MRIQTRIAGFVLLAASLQGANAAFVTGKVLPGLGADASGLEAPRYAGVSLLRTNIPGELALQLAGPDSAYPTRIFTAPQGEAYYLADAGSQWPTALALSQGILCVSETFEAQHGWQGRAYAGAVQGLVSKGSFSRSLVQMPDLWLSPLPAPELKEADQAHIALKVAAFSDAGGLAQGLALWRRNAGTTAWIWLTTLPLPGSGQFSEWSDTGVAPGGLYEYAVGLEFAWTGGGGAGARPEAQGLFSTKARSVGAPMAASAKQPDPSPVPSQPPASPSPIPLQEGWLAWPNPVHGDEISVAFESDQPCTYQARFHTLEGAKAREWVGKSDQKGQSRFSAGIKGLSSGIYILKVTLHFEGGLSRELPPRKIAVLK